MVEAIEKKINQTCTEPLSTRVVKGGLWVFALRIINRGLGFIRTIILARLLAPEDFGLLGIAMLAICHSGNLFSDRVPHGLNTKKGEC